MVSARREARDRHPQDLNAAIQHVSITAAQLFPPSHIPRQTPGCNILAADSDRPPTRARTTPDLEHHNGIYTLYGVDVTDVTRTFTQDEFDRLGREGQGYVHNERLRAGRPRGRGRGSFRGRGRGGGGRSVATLETRIAALESATQADDMSALTERQAHVDNAPPPTVQTQATAPPPANSPAPAPSPSPRGSSNGSNFGSGTYRRT